MNAAIIIGVALFSKVWSIRYSGRIISLELKWYRYLFFTVVLFAISIALYFFAKDE